MRIWTITNRWTLWSLFSCHDPFEPPHDKTNKMICAPAKSQISLSIRPVGSESSLCAWRNLGSSHVANHWAHSEDSDQTGRMPRLIWVFAGRTSFLLVSSWGDSFVFIRFLLTLFLDLIVAVTGYRCQYFLHYLSRNYVGCLFLTNKIDAWWNLTITPNRSSYLISLQHERNLDQFQSTTWPTFPFW